MLYKNIMIKFRYIINIVFIFTLVCLCFMIRVSSSFAAEKENDLKKTTIQNLEFIDGEYIQIKWTKVSNADGYQIYRSTSKNGTYKKIATVKSNKRIYNDNTAKLNKKYYYKIRAYAICDGKIKYGKFGNKKFKKTIVPTEEKMYSFLSISDSHIRNAYGDDGTIDLNRAIEFSNNSEEIMFICHCGDAVDAGTEWHLSKLKELLEKSTKPIRLIAGNHEAISENGNVELQYDSLTEYFGDPLYYAFEYGNDVFLMLGESGYTSGSFFAEGELQFMYDVLEANRNKRVFVYQHVFNWDDGDSGNPHKLYGSDLFSTGDQASYRQKEKQCFIDMLKHYKNTIWIHGHSHSLLELQDIESWANYSEKLGYRSLHNPSIAKPKNEKGEYLIENSQGYIIDVYANYIVATGRDFVQDKYLPISYKINTKLVNVKEKNFVDKTGIVDTH